MAWWDSKQAMAGTYLDFAPAYVLLVRAGWAIKHLIALM